jgi:hypothetical protein
MTLARPVGFRKRGPSGQVSTHGRYMFRSCGICWAQKNKGGVVGFLPGSLVSDKRERYAQNAQTRSTRGAAAQEKRQGEVRGEGTQARRNWTLIPFRPPW